jgi:hypothetical protein
MVAIKNIVQSSALLAAVVYAGEAPINTDNSKKAVARAHLDKGLVKGIIEFTTNDEGIVNVHLDVTGLPPNKGPFQYHIHDSKVSSSSNCEDAGATLNPFESKYEVCDDLQNDSLCAIGDLSGKHGYINTTCFETEYTDAYLSLNSKNSAYVGGKSLVITDAENNKISCGNIKLKRKSKLSRDLALDEAELAPYPIAKNVSTNTTNYEADEEDSTTFESGANVLIVSGLFGAFAAGLSALI